MQLHLRLSRQGRVGNILGADKYLFKYITGQDGTIFEADILDSAGPPRRVLFSLVDCMLDVRRDGEQ